MSDNKDKIPTIEQSLQMIEEKLLSQRNGKGKIKDNKTLNISKNTETKNPTLSNLFEQNKKKIIKLKKKDNVLLLTKKIDDKGRIVNLKKNKILQKKTKIKLKDNIEEKHGEEINLNIKDHKNLNKTTDLAVIIKKLRNIRDKKLNNKKKTNLKKINKEIRKLNETIDLAEDLFKKELLDL